MPSIGRIAAVVLLLGYFVVASDDSANGGVKRPAGGVSPSGGGSPPPKKANTGDNAASTSRKNPADSALACDCSTHGGSYHSLDDVKKALIKGKNSIGNKIDGYPHEFENREELKFPKGRCPGKAFLWEFPVRVLHPFSTGDPKGKDRAVWNMMWNRVYSACEPRR